MRPRLTALAVLLPLSASAYDFTVQARTIGQARELRRYQGPDVVLLARRRVTQMLSLRIFSLLPPGEPDSARPVPRLQIVGWATLDSDFGGYADDTDGMGRTAVPEVDETRLDLMLLYAEGSDFFAGRLDFRVGRQLLADPLDWYALDGADVVYRLPWNVAVEAFGGLEVKGERPLSSATFELDGTPETSLLTDEPTRPSPAFGGALSTWGLRDLQARASYRRTFADAAICGVYADAASIPDDGDACRVPAGAGVLVRGRGVQEEKAALSVRGRVLELAYPHAGARYNLLLSRLDVVEAGTRLHLHPDHAVTAAWSYLVPDFSGDSIFNLYSVAPAHEGLLGYSVRPAPGLHLDLRASLRRYANEGPGASGNELIIDPAVSGAAYAPGASALALWERRRGWFAGEARWQGGYGGSIAGGGLSGLRELWRDRVALEARLSLLRLENDVRDPQVRRDTVSAGAWLGALYRPTDGVALHVAVEDNRNAVYRHELRLLGVLDLAYGGAGP